MYWQKEVLRSGRSLAFNGTDVLDLPKTGLLNSLILYFSSTQNGQPFLSAVRWRLIDYISKIEVIANGSTVIKSYDGRQALASAWYDDGVEATSMWRHYSNTPHRQWIPIHFGQRFMDDLHGLDLGRYDQVQLKITNIATSTEFTTDIQLDVIAIWNREPDVASRGYYREEDYHVWAPAAGTWEYIDLPTELLIRRVLLRNRPGVVTATAKNASSMTRLMEDIRFSINSRQLDLWRGSLTQLMHLAILELGRYAETMTNIDRNDEMGYEVGVGYVIHGLPSEATSTATPSAISTMGAADVQDSAQEVQQRTADQPLQGLWRGTGYGHCVPLYIARRADLKDHLDPAAKKVITIDAQCASGTTVAGTHAAAESAIVLSRLVP